MSKVRDNPGKYSMQDVKRTAATLGHKANDFKDMQFSKAATIAKDELTRIGFMACTSSDDIIS